MFLIQRLVPIKSIYIVIDGSYVLTYLTVKCQEAISNVQEA